LCLMFESPRRGHLENAQGKPVSPEKLARMLGVPAKQLQGLLEELEEEGVFSRTDEGTIFCRRMVRDEAFRSARAQCGKLGGNPSLRAKPLLNQEDKPKDKVELNLEANQEVKQKDKVEVNLKDKVEVNQKAPTQVKLFPTPSSSSSSSTSVKDERESTRAGAGG